MVSLCLAPLSTLAYLDNLTDQLVVWVTLLAAARLPGTARSVLHMAGVVGLGVALQPGPQPSLQLALPALAAAILALSWLVFSLHTKQCHSPSKYLALQCVPGVGLQAAGLLALAWHESPTTHCMHHLARGAAILLLLPATVMDFKGNHYRRGLPWGYVNK